MPIPRLQLFELEDLSWFPPAIRDFATDYLHFIETRLALHKPVLPLLQAMLQDSRTSSVVDLGSGGGGPLLALSRALAAKQIHLPFTLTDKYPNLAAFQHIASKHASSIGYSSAPVDAASVPEDLPGLRTMFNAFHHFSPPSARRVLENAVQAHQPIAIFDLPERSLLLIVIFLFNPLYVALVTPLIKPFQWKRLLWTYIIPLVPFTCFWDGLVSACRAYTVVELLAMTQGLDTYIWKAGRLPVHRKAGHLTYLLGTPRTPPPAALL